jgi:hypothetical protein
MDKYGRPSKWMSRVHELDPDRGYTTKELAEWAGVCTRAMYSALRRYGVNDSRRPNACTPAIMECVWLGRDVQKKVGYWNKQAVTK